MNMCYEYQYMILAIGTHLLTMTIFIIITCSIPNLKKNYKNIVYSIIILNINHY